MALSDGFYTLGANINKSKDPAQQETQEGAVDSVPELELSMDDEELISLKKKWISAWSTKSKDLSDKQNKNEKYWKGQFNDGADGEGKKKPMADNLIFEAVETFLPLATKTNPEPVVTSDGTETGVKLADDVTRQLVYLADILKLKLSLKQVVRNWALFYLGVLKIGWSEVTKEITVMVVRPQKLILDAESTVVSAEYTGRYIGEYCTTTADLLVLRFPKKAEFIKAEVKDNMGSDVTYIEWWTPEFVFWTLKDEVLDKRKNIHWNYETESMGMDEFGDEMPETIPAKNHFPEAQMPYVFLSVFNLGLSPFDDTNLIEQNIALQDLIHKRIKQIDINADNTNGGSVVSGDYFSKEQAASVGDALRKGKTIWVPKGNVNGAYRRDTGTPLPQFVYESLMDYRSELRNIFGTRGSTAQGVAGEETVRGKILARQSDSDRIGGGFIDYLEQFSDKVFNWFVQMMYVYYDEPHAGSIIGAERAREYFTLKNDKFDSKLVVSVKDGSLIPKDSLTKRNEAIDLFGQGALDPISLFTALDFPNPVESAKKLFMWKSNPMMLFPDMAPPMPGMPPGAPPGQPGMEGAPPGMPPMPPQQPQDMLSQVPIQ